MTLRPESVAVSAGRPPQLPGAAVNQPISMSSTYVAGGSLVYAREGSATIQALEHAIGTLEGGAAVAFGSGLAVTAAILDGLPAGSTVVIPRSFYNFHHTVFDEHERLGRLTIRRVDTSATDAVLTVLDGASLLWLEIPTNPMLRVADLDCLAAAARAAGAVTVVDSTVATPLRLRPLDHGADVVVHSATKWIAGHSDVLLGLAVTGDPDVAERLRWRRTLTGAIPGSLESFLALRGVRTLAVRLDRAEANATEIAHRLQAHPQVSNVRFLGDPNHPDADNIASLLSGHTALLSFELSCGPANAEAALDRLQLITKATSLGGVESLIELRGSYPGELAQQTPAGLIRLSVGIEHVEDLWQDLDQAFDSIPPSA